MEWIMYLVKETDDGKLNVSKWSNSYATRDELLQKMVKQESSMRRELARVGKGAWFGFTATPVSTDELLYDPGLPNKLERYDP